MSSKKPNADGLRWLRNALQDALVYDQMAPERRKTHANRFGYCHIEVWSDTRRAGNRLVRFRLAGIDPVTFCDTTGAPATLEGPLSVTVETWPCDGDANAGRPGGYSADVIDETAAALGALAEKVLMAAGYTLTRAVQTDLHKLYRNKRAKVHFFPAE